jgi:hypothetical protein
MLVQPEDRRPLASSRIQAVNKRTGILQRDSAGFSRVWSWQLVFELFQATLYPCKLGLQGLDRPEFPE